MKRYKSGDLWSNFRMSVPLHERSLPIEDLLVMIMLVPNKGKEYHYARGIGRGSTQQLDQVHRSRWRLQASPSQP